jgi:hypothetical protein
VRRRRLLLEAALGIQYRHIERRQIVPQVWRLLLGGLSLTFFGYPLVFCV